MEYSHDHRKGVRDVPQQVLDVQQHAGRSGGEMAVNILIKYLRKYE